MKAILILLTTFSLAFAGDPTTSPTTTPPQGQDQGQEHRPIIKDPVLREKLKEMKELREKMEALRKEIKELAEKDGVKLPHDHDGKPPHKADQN